MDGQEYSDAPRCDLAELNAGTANLEQEIENLLHKCAAFAGGMRGRMCALAAGEWAAALQQLGNLRVRQQRLNVACELQVALLESGAVERDRRAAVENALESVEDRLRFFELEWSRLDEGAAEALLAAPELLSHRHFLAAARRHSPHLLLEPAERALTACEPAADLAWRALYDHLRTGLNVRIGDRSSSIDEALSALRDERGELRALALHGLEEALEGAMNILAHCYDTLVAHRLTTASLRGLLPVRAARDLDNELPAFAVDRMLDAIEARANISHAWFARKAALLGQAKLRAADERAPMGAMKRFPYPEAAQLVVDALAGLCGDAAVIAQDVLRSGHVDAEPRVGKQGRGRCVSLAPDALPYVLVNYRGRADDALTLSHELGHAVHFTLSGRTQPPLSVAPPAVLSEVPSTLAELIVADQLAQCESDPAARLTLIAKRVERCIESVFVSAALTRFEERAHRLRGEGHVLLPQRLEEQWLELVSEYYGPNFEPSTRQGLHWAFVPHLMHEPFYMYAYAFATLVCLALLTAHRQDPSAFAARFGDFLRRGGSADAVEQVRDLGFDPARDDTWHAGLDELDRLLGELRPHDILRRCAPPTELGSSPPGCGSVLA